MTELHDFADLELADAAETTALGQWIGSRLRAGDFVALLGELGAGKTTFVRGLARGLGLEDPDAVASPTYLLMVEHPGPLPLRHVDAYFAPRTRAFLDDGGGSWLAEEAGVTAVEWADRIADLLPVDRLEVHLGAGGAGRRVRLRGSGRFAWLADFPGLPGGH
ncbi:MAG: tRNA (adenosine(37)-N6)-threonylcarbamoyltransferase complex ATPase subunit type 1 TsaE [Planctomycetota bacterium]